jgi:CsoR family transcriptional regulator, copper-sensing transcriptional repressor
MSGEMRLRGLVDLRSRSKIPYGGYRAEVYLQAMAGYSSGKPTLASRLKRIEGQVRGIERMVVEDRYCIDVLTQVNATRAALEQVGLLLLHDHTQHCVAQAIESGDQTDKVRELSEAVDRFLRA